MFLFAILASCQVSPAEPVWIPADGQWLIMEIRIADGPFAGKLLPNSQHPCEQVNDTFINGVRVKNVDTICSPTTTSVYAVPVHSGQVEVIYKGDYLQREDQTLTITDRVTVLVIEAQPSI